MCQGLSYQPYIAKDEFDTNAIADKISQWKKMN